MAEKKKKPAESEVQDVLMDVLEVQLAAFRAGVDFWGAWVEQATRFSEEASARVGEIKSNPADTNRLLMAIGEASRQSLRAMSDLPRQAAERFIEELDRAGEAAKTGKKSTRRRKAKRSVRAKP